MKQKYINEKEILNQKILSISIVNTCELKQETKYGFDVNVELDDGYAFVIKVYVLKEGYPSEIKKVIDANEKYDIKKGYRLIIAPFISESSYVLLEKKILGL